MLAAWQDVLVSGIAAAAAFVLVRPFVPARWLGRKAGSSSGCASCAAGSACAAVPPVSASSTPVIQIRRPHA